MIEEAIRASDKFQIEIKSDYPLERERRETNYTIETYAFIPNSLDVNNDTYPKYLFYRDTQTYIRFRLPTVLLRDIASADSAAFNILEKSLRDVVEHSTDAWIRNCENQLRLFCCTLKYSVKDHLALIAKADSLADVEHLVEYYRDYFLAILGRFRKLRNTFAIADLDDRVSTAYAHVDEYTSILAMQYSFEILEKTRWIEADNSADYRAALLAFIKDEEDYRTDRGYSSVVVAGSDNEKFVYRRGALKRMMESILFLNTSVSSEGKISEQVIYSLAAGFAMAFATAVAFISQQKYGNFTMAFFVALVVSYMFKDRIKELSRLYINNKVQGRFFDRKIHICAGAGGVRLGYSQESFQFISNKRLQTEIRSLRRRDPFAHEDHAQLGEKIILYRKKMSIFSRNFEQVYQSTPIDGITDIWRMSIARLVRKMDNPKKPLFVLHKEGYRRAKASKVYHINLVIRYISSYGEEFRRFRLVINRNGIKRIEKVKLQE